MRNDIASKQRSGPAPPLKPHGFDVCESSTGFQPTGSSIQAIQAATVTYVHRSQFISGNVRENSPALELHAGQAADFWFAALAAGVSDVMYVLDASGTMTHMNTRGAERMGRSLQELKGSGWQTCVHPDDLETLCNSRADAIRRQAPYTATYRMGAANGSWRWVRDRATPIQWREELVWFGILDDIDEIISAQQQIEEMNRRLERSNHDLHHFASVVAHDLQSPLGTIGTMSTWLVEEYGDRLDANAQEYLSYMGKAVQRMNALVTAALHYSRVEANCAELTEKVDSREVLAWTLITLSEEIKQHHAVVTSDRLPKLTCSEHALVQLFQNLISNALRYCAPNTVPRIHVSAVCSATEWTFSVADNGIGIDPVDTDRIFELFQRINMDNGGVGIGLSTCRKVVENLGGRIWVESEPGKGSTFSFTVPR